MRLAACVILGAVSFAVSQDEWLILPLARVDAPVDSLVAAGLTFAPGSTALEVVLGFDNSCRARVSANYQAHGAVVKIRLEGPSAFRQCPAVYRPEAYRAQITGLKRNRYQVIVYTKDKGECIVVPRGVEHRPVAEEEVHLLLFEPAGTLNTGNVRGARTVDHPAWI